MKLKLVIVFIASQIMDTMTTYFALMHLGFREVNPIAKYFLINFGIGSIFLIKITVTLFIFALYLLLQVRGEKIKKSFAFSVSTGTIFTLCAVAINAAGILSALR